MPHLHLNQIMVLGRLVSRQALSSLPLLFLLIPVVHTTWPPWTERPNNPQVLSLQAEHGFGFSPERVHWRSNARTWQKRQTVWLKEDGEYLTIAICLPRQAEVEVESVRFSSDGWKKEAAVLIDGKEVRRPLVAVR